MKNHIAGVAGRYAGKIHAVSSTAGPHVDRVDLVIVGCCQVRRAATKVDASSNFANSEILNEDGSLRSSVFSQVLGEVSLDMAPNPHATKTLSVFCRGCLPGRQGG